MNLNVNDTVSYLYNKETLFDNLHKDSSDTPHCNVQCKKARINIDELSEPFIGRDVRPSSSNEDDQANEISSTLPEITHYPSNYKGDCIVFATAKSRNLTEGGFISFSNSLCELNVQIKDLQAVEGKSPSQYFSNQSSQLNFSYKIYATGYPR